jgi:hypothetical protein
MVLLLLLPAVAAVIKVRLTPTQLGTVADLAGTVVRAAEQVGNSSLQLDGPAKYEYAQTALTAGARRMGVRLKPEEANAFIHAALSSLNQLQGASELSGFEQGYEQALQDIITQTEAPIPEAEQPTLVPVPVEEDSPSPA